jgi:hypothetical protein
MIGAVSGGLIARAANAPAPISSQATTASPDDVSGKIILTTPTPTPTPIDVETLVEDPLLGTTPGNGYTQKVAVGEPYPGYDNVQACVVAMGTIRDREYKFQNDLEALRAQQNGYEEGSLGANLTQPERNALSENFQAQYTALDEEYTAYAISVGNPRWGGGSWGCDGTQITPGQLN